MAKTTKKSSTTRSSKRPSTNGAGAAKEIDTSRRYSKKEL